jgi:hypothetical protein
MSHHGVYTSPDSPGDSSLMQWIARHRDYWKDACLYWPYGCNSAGYAIFGRRGKMFYVHRYMCEYRNGPPPEGSQAAHSCSNGDQGCVNPRHLTWKTPSANQLDRRKNGRPLTGRRAVFSPAIVAEVRRSPEKPAQIAKRLGMTEANVRHIRAGRTRSSPLASA